VVVVVVVVVVVCGVGFDFGLLQPAKNATANASKQATRVFK